MSIAPEQYFLELEPETPIGWSLEPETPLYFSPSEEQTEKVEKKGVKETTVQRLGFFAMLMELMFTWYNNRG